MQNSTEDLNNFLLEDGIDIYDIEKTTEFLYEEAYNCYNYNNTLSLQNICLKSVSKYKKKLEPEFENLPSIISSEITEFNKFHKLENVILTRNELFENHFRYFFP